MVHHGSCNIYEGKSLSPPPHEKDGVSPGIQYCHTSTKGMLVSRQHYSGSESIALHFPQTSQSTVPIARFKFDQELESMDSMETIVQILIA
jgi:hypothetical protein